jgi:hypothetical protein
MLDLTEFEEEILKERTSLEDKKRIPGVFEIHISYLDHPEGISLLREVDQDFVEALKDRMLAHPFAVVAPAVANIPSSIYISQDQLPKLKEPNASTFKDQKLRFPLIGGNHAVEAKSQLFKEFKAKGEMKLAARYAHMQVVFYQHLSDEEMLQVMKFF